MKKKMYIWQIHIHIFRHLRDLEWSFHSLIMSQVCSIVPFRYCYYQHKDSVVLYLRSVSPGLHKMQLHHLHQYYSLLNKSWKYSYLHATKRRESSAMGRATGLWARLGRVGNHSATSPRPAPARFQFPICSRPRRASPPPG